MNSYRLKIKPYIQSFEKHLAFHELARLGEIDANSIVPTTEDSNLYTIDTSVDIGILLKKLSFWETVNDEIDHFTKQSKREATVNIVRNSVPLESIKEAIPFGKDMPLVNRRCLRYGTHGIHEYRGKFFPQLVRALLNLSGIDEKGIVVDPMCGSGTTLVESISLGYDAYGIDMNPLSLFMSKIKCSLLSVDASELEHEYLMIHDFLLANGKAKNELDYFLSLPQEDQVYLRLWFSEQVLFDLDLIMLKITTDVSNPVIRDFFALSLSNIIRKVSWQKEEDLRVRKEIRLDVDIDPIKEFLEEIGRSVRLVLAYLYENQKDALGEYNVIEGDAKDFTSTKPNLIGNVDCIITSPPYATALPYLDTDRLSLSYMGLLSRRSLKKKENNMIGNREISETQRKQLLIDYTNSRSLLPDSVCNLIDLIENLNASTAIGFRKKNLPSLLAKYFIDMTAVITQMQLALKHSSYAYLVVGNNHTVAAEQRIDILTTNYLVEIAKNKGFKHTATIPMDMLSSRDIFKRNAMSTESIIILQKDS